ncbi:hypothetical protein [Actinocorallia aurantiaca]|uniref:Phage terminase large subunit-like protein n=1 Tax=Actinocorallia aurantiaca TaxID=46204 RepID=A0ABN3UIB2_9ACTN
MAKKLGEADRPKVKASARTKPAKGSRPGTIEAKRLFLRAVQNGRTTREAMAEVGYSEKSYEYWRKSDETFRREVDLIRQIRANQNNVSRGEKADSFEEFRREYLNTETFPHQQRWIDAIEGREPRDLHSAMVYEPGDEQFVLINTPPEFSKSMTLTIDYVTYRICKDPNERVIIVSATQELAKKFVYAIKQRLTHPTYSKLQLAFAPADGFNGPNAVWQSTMVYLDGEARDGVEKDPNIEALGMAGQIYGSRATLIVCDDILTLRNAHQWESQRSWINQEVLTRIGPGGTLLVVGTRVGAVDLYKVLRDPDNYPDGESPWTYLSQPAVLEYAEDPEDWVTLWPKSDRPWVGSKDPRDTTPDADGLYPRWSGRHLAKRRKSIGDERIWALVYQQQEVGEESIFPPAAVRGCINGARTVGVLRGDNKFHHRPEGMQGLYVICSMDPAMAGETATIAYAVDMKTGDRWVLEPHRMKAPTPEQIRELIYAWTDKYKPSKWVIEKNAFQLFLTRDAQIRDYLAVRGCAMVEHYSGNNKIDPDFGVASLAPLFTEKKIRLPSSHNHEGMKALVEQLVTWRPGVKGSKLVQDLPMALWFAELQAREVMDQALGRTKSHQQSRFLPRYRQRQQRLALVQGMESWAS